MSTAVGLARQSPALYDIVIRGGTVIDGSGAQRFTADVAIAGGPIARVGDMARTRAAVDIDATGKVVTPGFVNVHSHATP